MSVTDEIIGQLVTSIRVEQGFGEKKVDLNFFGFVRKENIWKGGKKLVDRNGEEGRLWRKTG